MKATARRTAPPRYERMNRTEEAWAEMLTLDLDVLEWRYEEIRLRVGDGAFYTPDFFVITTDGLIEIHDTKGTTKAGKYYAKEAAMVRIRSCVERYPWFTFKIVWKGKDKQWRTKVLP